MRITFVNRKLIDMTILSDRLKAERKRLKIKAKDFAELTGIHPTRQSVYENNGFPEFGDYLEKAANLGVDVQYVLTGQRSNMVLTPEERELLQLYRVATLPGKAAAVAALTAGGMPAAPRQSVTIGGDNKGYVAGEGITVYASAKRTRNKRREDI